MTRQKKIIEEEIRKFSTFFTAEEVYERLREKEPNIGIATIYRYLNDTSRENKPHFYLCGRRRIYSFNKNNHCHFTCDSCGRTEHFNIDKIDFLARSINGKICHFQIDVYGICDSCSAHSSTVNE